MMLSEWTATTAVIAGVALVTVQTAAPWIIGNSDCILFYFCF